MNVVVAADVPPAQQNNGGTRSVRPGGVLHQYLLGESAPEGFSFRFYRSTYLPGAQAFSSPRHRHAFQQIRWTESGEVNYGPDQYIDAGDLAYFPRGAYYGPQLKDRGVGVLLQYGFNGEHQSGAAWSEYRQKAMDELEARGHFEGGIYVDVDPATGEQRQRDGADALYERQYEMHTGRKFVVSDPHYDSPILIHPAAFPYHESEPGLETRWLGRFFEHPGPDGDVALSMKRLSGGGGTTLTADRGQVAWSPRPGLRVQGTVQGEMACIYSPLGEKTSLSADAAVEVYVVEFPNPSS